MRSESIHTVPTNLITDHNNKGIPEKDRIRQFFVKGIWLYFFLLIFEGALRKWVLPSLAGPLLIVRDPVAIVLLLYAWYHNMLPRNIFIVWMSVIAFISIITTLFIGHGNLFVTIYGARLYLIHFPFIFLIGKVFNRDDVIKMGKVVLWISIPMAVLVAMQFYSPQSAWVNRGLGGDESGAGFTGAMGYYRPPGTFSFTSGTVAFFSLAGSYIIYFWVRTENVQKIILFGATIGLLMALPFSISRSLTFAVGVKLIFLMMTLSQNPKLVGKILVGGMGIGILIIILGKTGFLDTPIEVFLKRFEQAGNSEGGVEGTLVNRYLGGMYSSIVNSTDKAFFGKGIGMGSNAGSAMLGAGRTFLIAEGEWPRTIGEMGAFLGISVIAIRLIISAKLAWASYLRIQHGEILPWMLLSYALLVFPQGSWAQPTVLGFSTLIMGLLIASFNKPPEPKEYSVGIKEIEIETPLQA